MNRKIFFSLIISFTFFTFFCKESGINVNSNKVIITVKTTSELAGVASMVQRSDSLNIFPATFRYTKRVCCSGAPSGFRANTKKLSKFNLKL